MQTSLDCVPCFVRQTLDASRMVSNDPRLQERVIREVLSKISRISFDRSPAYMAWEIHQIIRDLTGCTDPYKEIKEKFNKYALNLYPELKMIIKDSSDPLDTAVRLAIAGNIIDFGVTSAIEKEDVYETVKDCFKRDFAFDEMHKLQKALDKASRILYLGDNAGEIVFDRLLIEEIPFEKVIFAVKGGPIINDATMEDAISSGITELVPVIDNGSNAPGTILELCSERFKEVFEKADLILAKGQANYETLSDIQYKEIFFLLKVKCPIIARDINCTQGDIVIKRIYNE